MLLTPDEVARKLKKSRRWVYNAVKRREIIPHRVGGSIRISQEDLDSYLDSCRDEKTEEKRSPHPHMNHLKFR